MVGTGELFSISQSSVSLPQFRHQASNLERRSYRPCTPSPTDPTSVSFLKTRSNPGICIQTSLFKRSIEEGFLSPIRAGNETQVQPDNSGGGDNTGGNNSNGAGGGGSDESSEGGKKKMALSMSQKLTLGYAALVGLGGVMGFAKSGSNKSLLAGGLSASLLYYVHTQLPIRPIFASVIGLGVSAALLVVMGSRFKRSGKVFPAGVVSVVSLIMTGGYLHGIFRSVH